MLEAPEVRYTRNGDVSLAYQVVGDGPIDIVEVPGLFTHLEVKWESPGLVRFIETLTRFARVILFDRRGVGLSDRFPGSAAPSMDEQIDDVRAVMDAAGSREAVMLGVGDGGAVAVGFAAAHPERTRALVLYGSAPVLRRRDDFPYGFTDEQLDAMLASVEREWGTGIMAVHMGIPDMRAEFARVERRACTPQNAAVLLQTQMRVDVRDLLPAISAPTLVIHYRDHPAFPIEGARVIAANVPGARLVELPGYSGIGLLRERRELAAAIEELLTGTATATDADRVLAAVLFTDIVGSTERAAALGDQRWRDLLDQHDSRVERAVEAAGGRVVKTTGDGVLARFDGAARALRCAHAIVVEARRLGVAVRAGVHVGECDQRGDDLGGLTVHVAARVVALAAPEEVLATSTVREALVGAQLDFEPRGTETLRGVPGKWRLFVVR